MRVWQNKYYDWFMTAVSFAVITSSYFACVYYDNYYVTMYSTGMWVGTQWLGYEAHSTPVEYIFNFSNNSKKEIFVGLYSWHKKI